MRGYTLRKCNGLSCMADARFDSKDDALEWLREGEDAPAAVNVIEMYACTRVDRLCNFKK